MKEPLLFNKMQRVKCKEWKCTTILERINAYNIKLKSECKKSENTKSESTKIEHTNKSA